MRRDYFVDRPFEEPRPGIEQSLAVIMGEILGVDRVSRTDSFFDFEGTSLQAVRLAARASRELEVSVLPVWVLEHDVLQDLAAEVATVAEATRPLLIHRAVEAVAAQHAERVAIRHGGRTVTYGQLVDMARLVAARLAQRGVGPGCIVPIMLPRCPELIVHQLACLSLGAAYSNLDHRWPRARLDGILERLGHPLTIVESDLAAELDIESLAVRVGDPGLAESRPPTDVEPEETNQADTDPALVIFTSGTTGRPKAVTLTHRAIVSLFGPRGTQVTGRGTTLLQTAHIVWDMNAFETWGQLTQGGTLIQSSDPLPSTSRLRQAVHEDGVDVVLLATGLFHVFVAEDVECFTGLRRVIVGGERLSPSLARSFVQYHPDIQLINAYGPAENGMVSTLHEVALEDTEVPGGVPLGRVLERSGLVVLEPESTTPLPAGSVGELAFYGDGLARDYHDEPELTARKFVEIPLPGGSTRCYRSGDLGLVDEDGVVHFLGRDDRQVKVSGHLVELDEVERAAVSVPGLGLGTVLTALDGDGRVEALTLVFTSTEEADLDRAEMRRQLAERLPPYMVPARIRRVEAMPLTPNGKIDQEAVSRLIED